MRHNKPNPASLPRLVPDSAAHVRSTRQRIACGAEDRRLLESRTMEGLARDLGVEIVEDGDELFGFWRQ